MLEKVGRNFECGITPTDIIYVLETLFRPCLHTERIIGNLAAVCRFRVWMIIV